MTLPDKGGYQIRFAPGPLPEGELCERLGGRLWLDALAPRTKGASKALSGPLGRARPYARTATVTSLLLEVGTIRCWIEADTNAPSPYKPRPAPTVAIPALDHAQWHDLTTITRPLAARLARLPAEEVLSELVGTGARCGIHLLPKLDQCHVVCGCSSRTAVCKHAATALLQTARCLDTMPLALLALRGRAAHDFFAGMQDPEHPSLHPHYQPGRYPHPPVISAETAYNRWQRSPRPSLPMLPLPPEHPAAPVPPGMPGADGRALADIATATSGYAHALLQTLTTTTLPGVVAQTAAEPVTHLAGEAPGPSAAAADSPIEIPLQQRLQKLQEATGLTKAELMRAVVDWTSTSS
ncbi:hypothetical protein [Streptomyces lydicus]|uniref:hypothetical protein n=1 Tax=Streptomyces lydicus TaxID=47763 RepID=UPI001010590B|nr:hypothetical protein [Streptomyces lydicus]MCZ1012108.1 hypothetical protein [Streptomyces lydicus]